MKKLLILAAVAGAAVASPAFAATQGTLDTTSSTGTLDLQVNIPKMVRVSGLDNLTLDITPAMLTEPYHSREDATDKFCVYSNDGANGAYKMSVAGHQGTGAPFSLVGPEELKYYMWSSDDTSSNAASFKDYRFNGQVTTYASNADGQGRRSTLDCGVEGLNASIKFGVNDTDLIAAQAGTYTDTVTITVSTI